MMLSLISIPPLPALWVLNFGVVLPLAIACLVLVAVIPSAARRGKLNAPLYALLLFGVAFVAFITGRLSGEPSVRGTVLGVVISIIFFLLVATGVGCFFAILFYRPPSEDSEASGGNKEKSSVVPALDQDRS